MKRNLGIFLLKKKENVKKYDVIVSALGWQSQNKTYLSLLYNYGMIIFISIIFH